MEKRCHWPAARPVSSSDALMQGPELSRAFMLRWDLYRQFFPVMALGRAQKKLR